MREQQREDQPQDYDDLSDERHPDHDLSEWGLRWDSEPEPKPWFMRRGVLLVIAGLVIASLLLPIVLQIF